MENGENIEKKVSSFLRESGYNQFFDYRDLTPVSHFSIKKEDSPFYNNLYILIEGYMDIKNTSSSENAIHLERIYPEDFQIAGLPQSFNSTCYTIDFSDNSVIFMLDGDCSQRLFRRKKFMEVSFKNSHLFFTRKLIENNLRSIMTVEEYLAYYLFSYAENSAYYVGNYTLFSRVIKCDRANLYRALASLEKKGLIHKSEKDISVLDLHSLRKIYSLKYKNYLGSL